MNVNVLIGYLNRCTEKLAEKANFSVGAPITLALKAFTERVADMEGFFFETVQ